MYGSLGCRTTAGGGERAGRTRRGDKKGGGLLGGRPLLTGWC